MCVIITTINSPTESIIKHINNPKYTVIIVGDKKTPTDYSYLNCIFLDIHLQTKLYPELSSLIPYNHYARKNIGYLYAIKHGYNIIYETDDDNIPYDNFDSILQFDNLYMVSDDRNKWINIFKFYTNNINIWQRGHPLSLIHIEPQFKIEQTDIKPSIINGLVENDPDVDAIYRLTTNNCNVKWKENTSIIISNKNVCSFNTQNTYWINNELFITMLIPSSVSFRYCDILRGIICNILLKKTGNYMMYTSPNVVQNRNEHNLINDLQSEIEMYVHNENILDFIDIGIESIDGDYIQLKKLMKCIYNNLLDNKVITQLDIDILDKWLDYF
jgi:hypothetical protein